MVLEDEKMLSRRNVRWRLVMFFLLVVLGALGLVSGHLGEGLADHEDYIDLPCPGSAALPFAEGSVCLGLWEYPLALTWMDHATVTGNATPDSDTFGVSVMDTTTPCGGLSTLYDLTIAYIEQSPRLLDNMALLSLFSVLLFVAAASSTFARRKRLTSVQRRKVLAKRQRSRLLAVLMTTTSAACRRQLSVKIAHLSRVITLLKEMILDNIPRRLLRRAPARRSLEREGANAFPSGVFMNLWACCWSAFRRAFGTSDMIAGLRATIERQSAVIDDTAAELQLAHREAATATSELTAARAERDAAVRDRILAEGTVEPQQAALAEQASVAAATATGEATAARAERDAAVRDRMLEEGTVKILQAELAEQASVAATATSELTVARAERDAAVRDRNIAESTVETLQAALVEQASVAAAATGEATAERAERDAAVRDRILAERTVETLQVALVEQTSLAAATAAASAVVASSELVVAEENGYTANSLATAAVLERYATNVERDQAAAAAVELRLQLSETSAAAATAANDLAVTAAFVVQLQAKLEQETAATTTAIDELAAAQKETVRAISASNDAKESRRLADLQRDGEFAASAELRAELLVQNNAVAATTEKLTIATREVARATSESKTATEECRLAESGRRSAVGAVAKLQVALARKTTEAITATEGWAASQREAHRAISEATNAQEGRRLAENELAAVTTSVVQLRAALADKTSEAATATTELKASQREMSRAISEATAAALESKAALVAQIAATATATSEGQTVRKEAARAILDAKESALGLDVSERERKCALAAVAELQAALQEKEIAAVSTASQLEAFRQEAARASSSASEAAQDRDASEQERIRAVDACVEMRSELEQVTAALSNTVNQLSAAVQDRDAWERERNLAAAASIGMRSELDQVTAVLNETASQLATSQQETHRAVSEGNAALLERDRATLERYSAEARLVEVQAALDRAQRKRGTSALEEGNSATTVTNVNGVAEMGTTVARKKARFAIFPSRNINAAAAAATAAGIVPNLPGTSSIFCSSNVSGNVGAARVASPIIAFYRDGGRSSGSGAGGQGTSLGEFLLQSNEWLENTHDYIQWVFPTQQASGAVRNAPVLTFHDLEEVARHAENMQGNMVLALEKMLYFYGLRMFQQRGNEVCIVKGANFNPEAKWMQPFDHNALRLTRMIMSLRLFKLQQYANALQAFLCSLPELRTHPSQEFWRSV